MTKKSNAEKIERANDPHEISKTPLENVSQAVMLMCPNADSVRDVTSLLLKRTKDSDPESFTQETAYYLATINELVLSWMAEGQHDELRTLASVFREVLASSALNPRLLSTMSQHDQLIVRIDILIRQIATLLRGNSLARYMGLLSGSRRESYRELLLGLYGHGEGDGAPVIRGQAWKFGPPGMKRAAGEKAVDKLAEMGLLLKQKAGPKNVQVELTWAGRRVAQAWLDATEQDEIEPSENALALMRGERMTTDLEAVGLPDFEPEDFRAINET